MIMQNLLKRYFWMVGALTVVLCAVFAASTVSHVFEAKVLGEATETPRAAAAATKASSPAAGHNKSGKALSERNVFCSDCLPVAPVENVAPTDGSVVMTSLPLALIATSVGSRPEYSFATVLNTDTQGQGGFFVGDSIPGGGPVKDIHYKYIDFSNTQSGGRLERIALADGVAPPPPKVAAVAESRDEGNKDELTAAIDAGIRKIDDTHFEVDRALIEKVMLNPMAIAKGARVVPSMKNGEMNGIKLYAIRPSSAYSKLGFSNGDTLHAVNGFQLNSAEQGFEIYNKLRDASSLQVDVTRRGKPVSLNYTIK
jgi:general secretion pathway protein C